MRMETNYCRRSCTTKSVWKKKTISGGSEPRRLLQNFPGITQIQGIPTCLCVLAQVEQDAQPWELALLCAQQGSWLCSHTALPGSACLSCVLAAEGAGCGHWPCSTGHAATGPRCHCCQPCHLHGCTKVGAWFLLAPGTSTCISTHRAWQGARVCLCEILGFTK